mgnify:CR=1 FL=1
MKTYEIVSTKRTKTGKLMVSLFTDVNHLVINAFVVGDEMKIEVGKQIAGLVVFGDKLNIFIIM